MPNCSSMRLPWVGSGRAVNSLSLFQLWLLKVAVGVVLRCHQYRGDRVGKGANETYRFVARVASRADLGHRPSRVRVPVLLLGHRCKLVPWGVYGL